MIVDAWLTTAEAIDETALTAFAHSALFDYLISGLYAALAFDSSTGRMVKEAYVHDAPNGALLGFYPYTWMCPGCVVEGVAPANAYIVDGEFKLRDRKTYPVYEKLSRPVGRMIGDLGAWCVRAIIRALVRPAAHFAAGGGHRGEFDLIISTDELLVLGETKASPLVAFPLVAELPADTAAPHTWVDAHATAQRWHLFVGAAEAQERLLPIARRAVRLAFAGPAGTCEGPCGRDSGPPRLEAPSRRLSDLQCRGSDHPVAAIRGRQHRNWASRPNPAARASS